MDPNSAKAKLVYFDGYGLGELPRLTLVECNLPFDDVRIKEEEEDEKMAVLKPSLPFGQLPVLERGNFKLAQSNTIVRYLAREYNLYGTTPEENAHVDMILEGIVDVRRRRDPLRYFDVDESLKQKHKDKYFSEEHVKWSSYFEKLIEENERKNPGSHWIVGATFTVADLALFNWFSTYFYDKPSLFSATPRLSALINRVAERPRTKAYLERRPSKASWDL